MFLLNCGQKSNVVQLICNILKAINLILSKNIQLDYLRKYGMLMRGVEKLSAAKVVKLIRPQTCSRKHKKAHAR